MYLYIITTLYTIRSLSRSWSKTMSHDGSPSPQLIKIMVTIWSQSVTITTFLDYYYVKSIFPPNVGPNSKPKKIDELVNTLFFRPFKTRWTLFKNDNRSLLIIESFKTSFITECFKRLHRLPTRFQRVKNAKKKSRAHEDLYRLLTDHNQRFYGIS